MIDKDVDKRYTAEQAVFTEAQVCIIIRRVNNNIWRRGLKSSAELVSGFGLLETTLLSLDITSHFNQNYTPISCFLCLLCLVGIAGYVDFISPNNRFLAAQILDHTC